MKKVFIVCALCLLAGIAVSSCGDSGARVPEPSVTDSSDPLEEDSATDRGRILIAYFSRTGYNYPNQWLDVGHTARVAGYIEELTGGTLFEIVPEIPYPDDYMQTVAIAEQEYASNTRPAIRNRVDNMDDYDIVFVGGPIWHGAMPMIIRTFYEAYDLTGKRLVPFTTHAGSGLGDSERLARSYYPENIVMPGLAILGTNSANARPLVEEWLAGLGLIENN